MQNFEELTTPPTMDDIFAAVKHERLVASPNLYELFTGVFMKSNLCPEVFNFGELAFNAIKDAEKEALDFIEHGHFTMPFDVCMMRVKIRFNANEPPVGTTLLVTRAPKDAEGLATVLFVHSDTRMVAVHSINRLKVVRALHVYASVEDIDPKDPRAVQLELPAGEHGFWKSRIQMNGVAPSLSNLCDGSMIAMGLVMILNTKGVAKERVAPATKPNAARKLAGKLPLPYITYVRTDIYNRAAAPGTGTHASPKPHIRRAHIRHYAETQFKKAYTLPIAAMLVNYDGSPVAERLEYRIKQK